MHKIGFIGAGNMAFALIKAIKKAKLASNIIASDINGERLNFVKEQTGIEVTTDNKKVIKKSDILFLAVKPQVMDAVLDEIKDVVKDQLIISIAAGIKIKKLEAKLKNKKIVRAMPSILCLANEMAAGFAVGKKVSDKDILIVEKLLNASGKTFYLKENLLDALTGLAGSGLAFVARLIEYFTEAGQKQGLNKDVASELTLQTFKGTAALLQESGMSPEELIKIASSPNGTTVAGREVLENSDVKDILIKSVKKATERSKELGKAFR